MMLSIILLVAGIAAVIIKANTAIIISDWIIYLVFGLSALTFIIQIISWIIAKNAAKKHFNRINKHFDNFKF